MELPHKELELLVWAAQQIVAKHTRDQERDTSEGYECFSTCQFCVLCQLVFRLKKQMKVETNEGI